MIKVRASKTIFFSEELDSIHLSHKENLLSKQILNSKSTINHGQQTIFET